MKLIHAPAELAPGPRKTCLAIGFFDGVHLGHQQIIRQTITDARQHEAIALVITFDQHPNTVVAPARVPPLIYSLPQKLRAIASLGADTLCLIRFDKAFSEQTGEDFIRGLARDLGHIQSLCVGANFVFGHKRGGNVALLKSLGEVLKFTLHGLAAVSLGGRAVSSTRVREAIRNGELDAAGQMMGRAYSLAGPVVPGDRLGHELGFPTANLATTGLILPPNGVYAVHATVEGRIHRGVANIGFRPTLQKPNPELRVEIHFLDFNSDLGGQEVEVTFLERLREEKRFASLSDLREQIARDVAQARALF